MTHLLDTDTAIDILRNRPETLQRYRDVRTSNTAVSVITVFELYSGCFMGSQPEDELSRVHDFLERPHELGFTRDDARAAARVRAELRQAGQSIKDCDVLLAGHALSRDLTFVTSNERHFSRIPALRTESWR
ncbi:tRNA(fMet)-specific endonuclease VapC [soil metagenome]